MPQERKFVLRQVATLIKLGISPMDIERSVAFVDVHLPEGADASTWIPTERDLSDDGAISEAALVDARANWYVKREVPRQYRRLLDARKDVRHGQKL